MKENDDEDEDAVIICSCPLLVDCKSKRTSLYKVLGDVAQLLPNVVVAPPEEVVVPMLKLFASVTYPAVFMVLYHPLGIVFPARLM